MRGVGDETPLPRLGALEPIEHTVHRPCQAGDLVVARWVPDSSVQLRSGDLVDLNADPLDRRQRQSHHPPGRHRDDHQQRRQTHREEPGDHARRVADHVEGTRDHHGAPALRGGGADRNGHKVVVVGRHVDDG